MDNSKIWHDTLEVIKIGVSPAIFGTWFAQTHLVTLKETGERNIAEIGCPTNYIRSNVESRYFGLIQDAITKATGKPTELLFVVKENPNKNKPQEDKPSPLFASLETPNTEVIKTALDKAKLRSNFTFEKYAVSGSNQMAHAAAEAVSKSLGQAYNPLFIYGGVGVGKSHLMGSVGNFAIRQNTNLKALFCTGEDFTNDIVEGIRNKTTQSFRNKYRKLDLLMVDDIQFIAGKDAVQEEFFHTFNTMTAAGGQVILTSDRPPSEISKLEERLRSRFEAGLIVDIAPPDFELRCAITQIKAQEKGIPLEMDQIQMIAGNIDGARKIEGILVKILTETQFNHKPLEQEMIERAIGKGSDISTSVRKATPMEVLEAVSKYYQIGKRLILSDTRARPIARPRQVLMYLLRTEYKVPLEEVGRLTGGRDHTTVMHAVEKITQLASTDVNIREDISKIKMGIR